MCLQQPHCTEAKSGAPEEQPILPCQVPLEAPIFPGLCASRSQERVAWKECTGIYKTLGKNRSHAKSQGWAISSDRSAAEQHPSGSQTLCPLT